MQLSEMHRATYQSTTCKNLQGKAKQLHDKKTKIHSRPKSAIFTMGSQL